MVDDEIASLRAVPGVEVIEFRRSSDEIDEFGPLARLALPLRPLWSPGSQRQLREVISSTRPDVLHLHNPYPLISPMVVRTAKAAGVPVVQTVHNHRLACVSGTLERAGASCDACVGKRFPTPSVRHGCYRGSRAQSLVMAGTLAVHKPTWQLVDRFLALTPALVAFLGRCGIRAEQITVKANSVPEPDAVTFGGEGFVYVGRLVEEKGIRLLLDAWTRYPVGSLGPLHVVGSGPLDGHVAQVASTRPDILVHGRLTPAETMAVMRRARVTVIPSTCPETFSRVAAESLALARPVLATNVGGLPHVVPQDGGWLTAPTVDGLWHGLRRAADEASDAHGRVARLAYVERYSEAVVTAQLLGVYDSLVAREPSVATPAPTDVPVPAPRRAPDALSERSGRRVPAAPSGEGSGAETPGAADPWHL